MRFFISSTFKDLEEYRDYTIKYLTDLTVKKTGVVVAMEFFAATSEDSYDLCLEELEKSDIVIGIYGRRFGWEPDGTGRSMTEIEFDRARELHIPVLKLVSYDDDREEKQKRFVHEKILVPGENCGRFRTVEHFADVLHTTLKGHFENLEGFSYSSIWDDIMVLRDAIEQDNANGGLRMPIFEDGREQDAIDQVYTSANFIKELIPLIYDMYNALTFEHDRIQLTEKLSKLLPQKWEFFFLGLPNSINQIRLAAGFLKVSHLQHRLLTETWTEELRQEIITARDEYIEISSNTYHVD